MFREELGWSDFISLLTKDSSLHNITAFVIRQNAFSDVIAMNDELEAQKEKQKHFDSEVCGTVQRVSRIYNRQD